MGYYEIVGLEGMQGPQRNVVSVDAIIMEDDGVFLSRLILPIVFSFTSVFFFPPLKSFEKLSNISFLFLKMKNRASIAARFLCL